MEIWFLRDMQRLHLERNAIRSLQEEAEWLAGTDWVLDSELCVDAVIKAHGNEYQVRMTYPALFPSVPPVVSPKNPDERWSTHQYLGGALCLEWGPDTWHPDVTGAQVLESAYELLRIENPLGSDRLVVAPSRHYLSVGQTLRASYARLYLTSEFEHWLTSLPCKSKGLLELSVRLQSRSFLVLIHGACAIGGPKWDDTAVPISLRAPAKADVTKSGVFFKTNLDPDTLRRIDSITGIESALDAAGYGHVSLSSEGELRLMGLEQPPTGVLLMDSVNEPHFLLLFDTREGKALQTTLVRSEAGSQTATRIPVDLRDLSGKSVGIVGLGSVGSRIALSLARTGVGKFYLVDEDVFLPENICRHVFDWRNVGEHKVDALAEMLSFIAAGIEVEVSRLNLTGQESTASLSGVLDRLGRCDLIVDATAVPQVFNLLAAVATTYERPIVWAEVYAGGIGGLVARSRPRLDPDPFTMRAAYNHFTTGTPAPDLSAIQSYAAEDPNGRVVSASDADVSILAYHCTRLAIDTLLGSEPSSFPYSMYLIGLAHSWIFKAPFHTIPIDTNHLPRRRSNLDSAPPEALADGVAFLSSLLEKRQREDPSS